MGKCEAVKECIVKEMGKKIGVVVYCDEDKQQQVRDFITEQTAPCRCTSV